MSFIIYDMTLEYRDSPTAITIETDKYPIQEINYPAISICSINKISLSYAIDLAKELYVLDYNHIIARIIVYKLFHCTYYHSLDFKTIKYNFNLTVEELTSMITIMGNFYHFDIHEDDLKRIYLLHSILDRVYNGYNVERIMKRLLPKCRSFVWQCSWNGKDQDCNEIFFLKKTSDGYCCTFNSARRFNDFGDTDSFTFASQMVERSKETGSEYGLSVLLNPQLYDYAYKLLPIIGLKILIYSSFDYPNTVNGGVREVFVPPKVEMFLNLNAINFYSLPDVIDYDINQRDCLFSTEQAKIFGGYYSYTNCISHCRTQDIISFCKCIPFFYPITSDMANIRNCNLKDLLCLKKYKDRWLNLEPRYEKFMESFHERKLPNGSCCIKCDCLPSCEDITYTVSISDIPLNIPYLLWNRKKTRMNNHSLVHIYFGSSGTTRIKQDMFLYWYELMSNYGGICSLFLGISIISLIEMLYFFIIRLIKSEPSSLMTTNSGNNVNVKTIIIEPKESDMVILYWKEISGAVSKDIDLTALSLDR
ncbi:sodium channel protein Nach-like [Vespa mandarinia]|uniref:sodium channel protein Nach-like n=1 Tax=Vespa mandarinia TaxID=7446 RepID=UPI0016137498|nr:sodium channel protein Nach-like [Vespa mandarinia]